MDKLEFFYVTYIATTPEKLWTALTSAEFTRQYWFGMAIESDWRVGSSVLYRQEGEITDRGTVLTFEPPRLLSYTFHPVLDEEMRRERPSRVSFEIEPLGGKTEPQGQAVRLTVTHDDFPPESKVFPRIRAGWPAILSSLKSLLEGGKPLSAACR